VNLQLVRIAYLPDVTLGWLTAGDLRLATLEEPWRPDPDGPGGQRREGALLESCVPDGTYRLSPHSSQRWPNVWRLSNPRLGVYDWPGEIPRGQPWGRSAILIHNGNTAADILGCILVGRRHGRLNDQHAVLQSTDALNALRQTLGVGTAHTLTIRPVAGTAEVAA
jgi:hypothetical protein